MGDLSCPFGTEGIEEAVQRGVLTTGGGPHQPARVVVDDHHKVTVAPLVGDLVDPDAPQACQAVDLGVDVSTNALDDGAHGAPRHPQQLHDRALGGVHGQPGGLVIEVAGVASAVARPGNLGHRGPVTATAHPGSVGFQEHSCGSKIKGSPAPATFALVIAGRAPATTPTSPASLGRRAN